MLMQSHEANPATNKGIPVSPESPQASRLTLQNPDAPILKARAFSQKKITITSANNQNSHLKYGSPSPSFDLKRFFKPVNQPNPSSQWKKTSIYIDKDRDRKISLRGTGQVYNSNCTINPDLNSGFSDNLESKLDHFGYAQARQKQVEEVRREVLKSLAGHVSQLHLDINSQAATINSLQSQIAVIEEELKNKNVELASVRRQMSSLAVKSKQDGGINDFIARKIDDLEKVARLIGSEGKKDQQQINRRIQKIDSFAIKYLHHKLTWVQGKVGAFISSCHSKLEALQNAENTKIGNVASLQLKINCMLQTLMRIETSCPRATEPSTPMRISASSHQNTTFSIPTRNEASFHQTLASTPTANTESRWEELSDFMLDHSRQKINENESSMSFADDYFFHPEPLPRFNQREPDHTPCNFSKMQPQSTHSNRSQRLQMLIHILKIHERPLPCIIDSQGQIVSMLTNEHIVNESGEQFRLTSDEIKTLQDGNLLKIHKRFDQTADCSGKQKSLAVDQQGGDRDYWESFHDY